MGIGVVAAAAAAGLIVSNQHPWSGSRVPIELTRPAITQIVDASTAAQKFDALLATGKYAVREVKVAPGTGELNGRIVGSIEYGKGTQGTRVMPVPGAMKTTGSATVTRVDVTNNTFEIKTGQGGTLRFLIPKSQLPK